MTQKYSFILYSIGEIRDYGRLKMALVKDVVIYAAALNQLDINKYNPFHFIKIIILSAQNLVKSCLEIKVSYVIPLSSYKVFTPIKLFKATKLFSYTILLNTNLIKDKLDKNFLI